MFSNQERDPQSAPMTNNTLGSGTTLKGNLSTTGNLRVDGKITGDVRTGAKMVQGETSVIEGNIKAQSADIGGKIKGKVVVDDVLVLEPNSVIQGDIVTNRLIVESGAKFNGQCKIGGDINEFETGKSSSQKDKGKEVYKFEPKTKASTA